MTDRVPGAPGQYKAVITESELQKMQTGEQFTITMTRDDQPITEGTPYSKATVLPDELAKKLCPDIEDPSPADAFRELNNRSKTKAGLIYPLAASVVPDGFLLCDGAEYERAEYPELFAAIGTIYGTGDGETTFNVPNLQTRVPVGSGDGYKLGQIGGEAEHTLTVDEMPNHNHGIFTDDGTGTGNQYLVNASMRNGSKVRGSTDTVGYTGDGQPHNNMQPYTVVNYIIATGKDTAVSVADIVMGAQAIPLEVQYGGTGATGAAQARENLGIYEPVLLWEDATEGSGEQPEQVISFGDVSGYSEFILQFYNHGQFRSEIGRHIHVNYVNIWDSGIQIHKRTYYLNESGNLSISKCLAWNKNEDVHYQDNTGLLLQKVYGVRRVDK